MTDDLRTHIARTMAETAGSKAFREPGREWDHLRSVWLGHADAAIRAMQGRYVPPPPGSDRDKLPDHVLAAIGPHLRPYLSTACETAQACHIAAARDLDLYDELRDWGQREHSACRLRRKQDVADCGCRCHQETGR